MIMSDVESSVPLPSQRISAPQMPFAQMQVGDSFLVVLEPHEVSSEAMKKLRAVLTAAATRATRKIGGKYSVRRVEDDSYRVWRVA